MSEPFPVPNMDTPMTPEERFTKIENLLEAMAEHQAHHDEDIRELRSMQKRTSAQLETLTSDVGTLASTTTDLSGVSRHLVNVQAELIESNSFLRQLVESHAKRLERLEGESFN